MSLRRERSVVVILCNVKFWILNCYIAYIIISYIIDNNMTSHTKKEIGDDVNGFIAVDIFANVSCVMPVKIEEKKRMEE